MLTKPAAVLLAFEEKIKTALWIIYDLMCLCTAAVVQPTKAIALPFDVRYLYIYMFVKVRLSEGCRFTPLYKVTTQSVKVAHAQPPYPSPLPCAAGSCCP